MTIKTETPLTFQSLTTRQVILGTLVVLAVAMSFGLLYQFRVAAFSLFEAIVISTAISPAVEWLYRHRVPRAIGIVVIYLLALALAVGFMLLVVPLVVEQAATLTTGVAGYYANFLAFLRTSPSALIQRLAGELPPSLPLALTPPATSDGQTLDVVAQALSYMGLAGHSLFIFIAVLLLAFYWTLERERVLKSLLLLAHSEQRESLRDFITATETRVGGYIRGIAALSLIVGTLALLAYLGLGLPSALLLGLVAGVMEAIPIIGPTLGAIPAVLIALAYEPSKVVWVVAATVVIQFIENTILVPKVMGRAVGVNTVVALLALAAFSALFGLAGAFLAIPLAAIIQLLLDRFVLGAQALKQTPEGRDNFSVLRVEVQELVQDVRKQIREKPVELRDMADEVENSIEAVANELDSILAQASQIGSQTR